MIDIIALIGVVAVYFILSGRIQELKDKLADTKKTANGFLPEEKSASEERPIIQIPSVPISSIVEREPVPAPAAIERPASDSEDVEFKIGGKLFTGVGIVAVIFAIGFFLRYAFETNLINEAGRVILGLLAGVVLLGVGEFTRKRFPKYGQALTGGGLGVLYLSIYAAYNFYNLTSQPVSFAGMIIVTAIGILLALRQNSIALAGFAQLGGFLTPLLLSTGTNNPHSLFIYIAILDIGVLVTAFYKLWRQLAIESIIGSALAFSYWYSTFYDPGQFAVAMAYLTLFFTIFLGVTLVQYFIKKSPEDSWDYTLTSANPLFYFLMSYSIIHPLYPDFMGLFTIILGIFYCVIGLAVRKGDERSSLFSHFLMSIGLLLLVVAVPIQLHKAWITIMWAAEAVLLIVLGFRMRFQFYRILGHCVFFAVLFRLLFFDMDLDANAAALANIRFFTYIASFIMLLAAAYVYRRRKTEISADENSLFSVLAVEAAFVGLAAFSLEIKDFFGHYWYPVLWTLGGLVAGWASFRLKNFPLRLVTYITFVSAFFHLLAYETGLDVASYKPVFNTRVFSFLVSAAVIRLYLQLFRGNTKDVSKDEKDVMEPTLFLAFHSLLLWLVSTEIINYFDHQIQGIIDYYSASGNLLENMKNVGLSVAWTFYGIVLMVIGIVKKSKYERFLAIALFSVVIFKVFLIDTSSLNNFYRFVSFITLGCILLLTGYLYYRYEGRIRKFVQGQ